MNDSKKICFAGPPGSGKTTVLSALKELPMSRDHLVLFQDEVATMFLKGRTGYINEHETPINRQFYIYRSERALEKTFEQIPSDKPKILICDRGVHDAFVYLSPDELKEALTDDDLREISAHVYDRVFYFLPGSANQAHDQKTLRIESSDEETNALTKKSLEVWKRVCDPSSVTYVPVFDDVRDKTLFVAKAINDMYGRVFLI